MREYKSFRIEGYDNDFRIAQMPATEIMALRAIVDFDEFEKTAKLFKYALEHIELRAADEWIPVKEKDEDVYYPKGIDEDVESMDALLQQFMSQVIKPLFPKSSESKKAQ